jgi:hypothetical protein
VTVSVEKLIANAQNSERYGEGEVVLSLFDVGEMFPELQNYVGQYAQEIQVFKKGIFPITPKQPASFVEIEEMEDGSFLRLPKQYRRFFGYLGSDQWRSFKGFDPVLGECIIRGKIDIRRGVDSPLGMKWLSGQIYTSVLAWAIHAEHIRRFGELANLPLPIVVMREDNIFWGKEIVSVADIDLQGNRNYLWSPGKTSECLQKRSGIVQRWLELLPDTCLSSVIRRYVDSSQEWLGGVVYDMRPVMRLDTPKFFTAGLMWQQENYTKALERPLRDTEMLFAKTEVKINSFLRQDTSRWTEERARNAGRFLGICRRLRINVLSFGIEPSNIDLRGSLPDMDTLQYRRDSIEFLGGIDALPPAADFRFLGLVKYLTDFEKLKSERGFSSLSKEDISQFLASALQAVGELTEKPSNCEKFITCSPDQVMLILDQRLTVQSTISHPSIPCYQLSSDMPAPEGVPFLLLESPDGSRVVFNLLRLSDFVYLDVHHYGVGGQHEQLPGDYFPCSLDKLPCEFFDYIEEYMRTHLRKGISRLILYLEHIQ